MSVELKTVRLYGHLGKKFGTTFQLAVNTPAEALRALSVNLQGFKAYIKQHNTPGFHVFLDSIDIGSEEIGSITTAQVIKIVPVTVGSGRFFKIVLGIALMVYAPSMSSAWFSVGTSLVLSGVSDILFTPPKPPSSVEKPADTPSYVFNGPINTTGQGNAIALCYGKVRVGSQVISAGLTSREIPI